MSYIPVVAGAVHKLCAIESQSKLKWPTIDRDFFFKKQQKENIINSTRNIRDGVPFASLSTVKTIAIDTISYLLDIIKPKINVSAFISTNSVQHCITKDVISIMAGCGISYISIKGNFANNYNEQYQLEPNLNELTVYKNECIEMKARRSDMDEEVINYLMLDLQKFIIKSKEIKFNENTNTIESERIQESNLKSKNNLINTNSNINKIITPVKLSVTSNNSIIDAENKKIDATREQQLLLQDEGGRKRIRVGRMDSFFGKVIILYYLIYKYFIININ